MGRIAGRESSSNKAKEQPPFRRALRTFRARVRELRRMHGMSYRTLDERSGVNWRLIVAIERGEVVNPTLVTLTRLAEALGVEVRELLTPGDSDPRQAAKAPARTPAKKKTAKKKTAKKKTAKKKTAKKKTAKKKTANKKTAKKKKPKKGK